MAETHKVAELEGALLDAAVAMAEGHEWEMVGDRVVATKLNWSPPLITRLTFMPSTDHALAGKIIDRERIATAFFEWTREARPAEWRAEYVDGGSYFASLDFGNPGPTRLIAAMRAYVASKFGEEVTLP